MTLTLTLLRCPDGVAPETRVAGGGEFSIGRGPDNDWVLPDPDRHLSKRHCVLAFRSGGWQVAGTSSNGTFLNPGLRPGGAAAAVPLEEGGPRTVADGDRLVIGPYEVELRLASPQFAAPAPPMADPFGDDPFAPPPRPAPPAPPRAEEAGFGFDPWLHELGAAAGGLPASDPFGGEDPLASPLAPRPGADREAFGAVPAPQRDAWTPRADHSPAVSDAFRPAPPRPVLPDDWDLDLGSPPASPSAPPPVPPPVPRHDPDPSVAGPPPVPAAASPRSEAAVPDAMPPSPRAPPPRLPDAPSPASTDPAPAEAGGDDALLAAFLRGAGLEATGLGDAAARMEHLGAAFRAVVAGLRQSLIARASIKGEFRINQTMVRTRGNNPLKFSADDEDALMALLGLGRRSDMGPAEAVADALADIRTHELATVAAMQEAVRALVARLAPAGLREAAGEGGGLRLPGGAKARAWDAFEALHAQVSRGLSDDFDSVFGRSFARAYERASEELSRRQDPS